MKPAHLTPSGWRDGHRTLCGITSTRPEFNPAVCVEFFPAHHLGYWLAACPVCADVWARSLLAVFTA
jgi:hypothetical protein